MEAVTLKLSRKTKLMYGAGDFGFAMTGMTLGLLFAVFLTDVVGLDPGLAAAAIFIGRTWDYINDPIVGYLSDRMRSRWGRRRPFILFGFVPFGISFVLMWLRPEISSPVLTAAYYGAAYFFFDTFVTINIMPYYALTPDLTDDYDERTSLTTYRMVFSIIGTMTAFILPSALIGRMIPENYMRIFWVMLGLAVVGAFPLLLVYLGTKERNEYQEMPAESVIASLKAAWKCIPFRYTMGIFLFTFVGLEVTTSMMIYFLKYRMNLGNAFPIVGGGLFGVALLMLPFWRWVAKKWNKRTAFIAGMVFMSAVMMLNAVIQPQWGLPAMVVIAVLAGMGFSCIQVLPWAIFPDVVEWDEYNTGQRHEGTFYSLVLLFRKIANSMIIPLALLILKWTGYVANVPQQKPSAVTAIVLIMSVLPAACFLVGGLFARGLPITRESFAHIRAELEKRRAAKGSSTVNTEVDRVLPPVV